MSEAPAAGPKPASKKKLLLGIVAIALVGAGGGVFYMTNKGGAGGAEAAKAEQKLPAQYVALDPPFVVNFEPGSRARFLQVAVQLMTRDPQMVGFLKANDPAIRNDLLLLFGNKSVDEVSSQQGKEALRQAALETIRTIIEAEGGSPDALEAVYFTSFVMQ